MNEIKTIKMQRTDEDTGEIKFADVHPNEVANWHLYGWEISPDADTPVAETEKPRAKKR